MKNIVFNICFLIITSTALAQNGSSNQATSLCGGRWEFFMSEIQTLTLKIDKFTGETYQLLTQEDKSFNWKRVRKEYSYNDNQNQDSINYQLFSSGLFITDTFLLNTNTGQTWQLIPDENRVLFFNLIKNY